jgi:N-acetylglutamate synthase-like GNAT family acetyltransferase
MYFIRINFATPEFDEYCHLKYAQILEPLGLDLEAETTINEHHLAHYQLIDEQFFMIGAVQLDLDSGKISGMLVKKELQGRGFGKIMLQNIEKKAMDFGLKKTQLYCTASTKGFYTKMGYSENKDKIIKSSIMQHHLSKML